MSQETSDRWRRANQLFVEAYRLHMVGDIEGILMASPKAVLGGVAWRKVFGDLTDYYRNGTFTPELPKRPRGGTTNADASNQRLSPSTSS